MHGVRIELAQRQAHSIGLPLDVIYMTAQPSNGEYQEKVAEYLLARKAAGVTAVGFGDIFLEDLKQWRESQLAEIGLRGIFPLWKRDTKALIDEFLDAGFRSIACCVDGKHFNEDAVGLPLDRAFIGGLPATIDPCGENGEFHSFTFAGPIFSEPIEVDVGEKVFRDGFWFCDLSARTP